jgi:hypothetical protein
MSSDEEVGPGYISIHSNRIDRARRYDEIRTNRQHQRGRVLKFMTKMHIIRCITAVCIYLMCPLFAGDSTNYYTLNHLAYNKLNSLTLIKWDLVILAGIFLKDNIG